MTHRQLLSQQSEPDRRDTTVGNCDGACKYEHSGFWDDCSWTIYRCAACGQRIAACGGGVHWWNYVLRPKAEAERLETP